ncbi:hypothetical protein Tco_0554662 [Tanacetum coccineum]
MLTLKWRDLPSVERHAYCEKLLKLQERSFGVPRVANWRLFDGYGFEDTLREMMKLEYINEGDGDIFVDYSWERALSIDNEIYPEWVLEFFSTLYFDKDVDRNNLMKEKYDEIKKCSEPIVCEYWISKMLTDELDMENTCGGGMNNQGGSYGLGGDDYFTSAMPNFRGSSSGYAVEGSSRGAGFRIAIIDMGRGYGTYKKIDGDGDWHARFEIVSHSGRKFNQAFKTKTTTRKLSGKFKTEDLLREDDRVPCRAAGEKIHKETLPNPLIAEYERSNKRSTITYLLQPVSNANLKWKDFPSVKRHASCEKLSKLQERSFGVPRTNLMKEKCIWFRLCGHEHILTLPEFAVVLGLFMEDEVEHRLFEVYFGKLEVDDKQFDYKDYWTRVGKPTLINHKEVLVKEPLMRIVHKVIVGSLVHRVASRERCQKRDLWMMSALEQSRGVNLAWIIADHLYKHASGTKENSVICTGHYVTRIASFLGYCVDDEIKKYSKPIDCEYWTSKMLADELDEENTCLKKETRIPT